VKFQNAFLDAAAHGFCIPMRSECYLWMSPQHFLYVTGLFTFAP